MADAGFQAATEWDSVQMWRAGPTSQKSIGVVRHTSGLQKKDLTVLSTDPEKASGPRAPIRDHLSLQSRNGPELPRLGKKKKKPQEAQLPTHSTVKSGRSALKVTSEAKTPPESPVAGHKLSA